MSSEKNMEQGLVSVVIPAYNGRRYIREAIGSVMAQSYRPLEILVVDDGSLEDMADAAEGFGNMVRYLRKKNGGTASARNVGVREARGEFIALLDQDDLWLPHKLERQIPRFAEDPKIGLVVAWMEIFNAATGEAKGSYRPPEELGVHEMLGYCLPPVQTMVFRRSVLEELRGFDESLRGTDDWDINIRVAREYRVVTVPEILARGRMHPSQQGGDGTQMYVNSMRVLKKHESVHADCTLCREAVHKSRKLVREYYYNHIRSRARVAWREGHYTYAIAKAAQAFWQYPPALPRVIGRALCPNYYTI